jgi:hypothetical protein
MTEQTTPAAEQPKPTAEEHAQAEELARMQRAVKARDDFGRALMTSLPVSRGAVTVPLGEILITQRIEKIKLACLMEVLEATTGVSLDAVLDRFIARIEQETAELLKPKIARGVHTAMKGNRGR